MYVNGLVCLEQQVSFCFGHLFSFNYQKSWKHLLEKFVW